MKTEKEIREKVDELVEKLATWGARLDEVSYGGKDDDMMEEEKVFARIHNLTLMKDALLWVLGEGIDAHVS